MKKRRIGFGAFDDDEDEEQEQEQSVFEPSETDDLALKYFTETYPAAANFKEAVEFMTTAEVYTLMSTYIGGLSGGLGYKQLMDMLRDEGYTFGQLDGGKFVWLLKTA